jgi:hypothetical protein
LREFEGVTHARFAGRDGGVAGRYAEMWLGGTPDKLPKFRCPESMHAVRAFRAFAGARQ